jgi:hypothetical protein
VDPCPDFVQIKRGSLSIVVHRSLAEDSILNLLGNPDVFFSLPKCQIIKDQRKIKVARLKLEIGGAAKTVFVKRYNAFSWRYRLGSLFQLSGAAKSLKGAAILAEAGIRTAAAVAAVESRTCGMLNNSFYLSDEIEDGQTADVYWREGLSNFPGKVGILRRRRFLTQLGKLFFLLHSKRVYHNDLKDANIIVSRTDQQDEGFYLLDLEGVRIVWPLTMRRRIKNFVQLNRTLGGYLSTTQKLHLLKSYLGADYLDKDKRRFWMDKIIRDSRRGDRRSLRKAAHASKERKMAG